MFFLSALETYTDNANAYGFISNPYKYDEARRSGSSVYAKAMGTYNLFRYSKGCIYKVLLTIILVLYIRMVQSVQDMVIQTIQRECVLP